MILNLSFNGYGQIITQNPNEKGARLDLSDDIRRQQIQNLPDVNKRYAVVIGVNSKDLNAAEDAEEFGKVLSTNASFNAGNITTLATDKNKNYYTPTHDNILQTISQPLPPKSLLLIFFSGHGQEKDQNFSFLCAQDEIVRDWEITEAINKSGASQAMIFIDACRSEVTRWPNLFANPKSMKLDQLDSNHIEAYFIFYATSPGYKAYANENGRGYFSNFLIEAFLGNGAVNSRGTVQLQNLVDYVQNKVKEQVKKDIGNIQIPFSYKYGYANELAISSERVKDRKVDDDKKQEEVDWRTTTEDIKKIEKNPEILLNFIKQWPEGRFTNSAKYMFTNLFPKGVIVVALDSEISTETAKTGQDFSGTVVQGNIRGTSVVLTVGFVEPASRGLNGNARLGLILKAVKHPNGKYYTYDDDAILEETGTDPEKKVTYKVKDSIIEIKGKRTLIIAITFGLGAIKKGKTISLPKGFRLTFSNCEVKIN